jgi:signal transduction histidine kinase/CheY-like chemotaxis protein
VSNLSRLHLRVPLQLGLLLIASLGTLASMGLWWFAIESEISEVQAGFEAAAGSRSLAIYREIDGTRRITQGIFSMLNSSPTMGMNEVEDFVEAVMGQRVSHYSLDYVSGPRHLEANYIGLDPLPARTLKQGRAMTLVDCPDGPRACLRIEINDGRSQITMTVRMSGIAGQTARYIVDGGIRFTLRHEGKVIVQSPARAAKPMPVGWTERMFGGLEPLVREARLDDLRIEVVSESNPGWMTRYLTWQPWILLASGLLITLLVAMLYAALKRYTLTVEQKVASRTAALRAARDEAGRASMLKSQFLANLSHEVRTPLNTVLGLTGQLLDGPLTGEQREHCLLIERSGRMLLDLMNDMLDLSRIESGHMKLEQHWVDLQPVLQHVIDTVHEMALQKNLRFLVSIEGSVPAWCWIDPVRLKQIALNLLGNAVKFTAAGEVRLEIGVREQTWWMRVTDSGPGIAPADQQRIFERFLQTDGGSERRYGGAGLGLAITRELCELLGGDVSVKSEPGKGAMFEVVLPLRPDPPTAGSLVLHVPSQAIRSRSGEMPALRGLAPVLASARILLVEDNPANQFVAATMFSRLGCKVDIAENGLEALKLFEPGKYSLIFMDCQMPEMDGFEATRQILNRDNTAMPVPIIALTANAMAEDRQRCLDAGMVDFLSKPIEKDLLRAVIERWVEDAGKAKGPASHEPGPSHENWSN